MADTTADAGPWTGIGHGKVILLGEHAVVHGQPALAAPLARGCRARARAADSDTLRVMPWGTSVVADASAQGEHAQLQRAFAALVTALGEDRGHFHVDAELDIPAGAGLGASAALSVAIARAVDACAGTPRDNEGTMAASLAWEGVFHGNPSGIDSAMATHGEVSLYRRGAALQPVSVGRKMHLVVGHSGQAPSTRAMVESVARQLERAPDKIGKVLDGIGAVVANGRTAIESGQLRDLGQLMVLNQKLLNTLLLSTTRIEEMCQCATAAGALGAKLTGGGGGGCMIALGEDHAAAEKIVASLGDFDPAAFIVEVG